MNAPARRQPTLEFRPLKHGSLNLVASKSCMQKRLLAVENVRDGIGKRDMVFNDVTPVIGVASEIDDVVLVGAAGSQADKILSMA